MIEIRPGLVIPDRHLHARASRSGGPGGQHVNKTETKVDLRFDFEACDELRERTKRRLRELGSGRLDRQGRLVFVCGRSRSQADNRRECELRLRELVLQALAPPAKKRRPTKPTRGSQRRRVDSKKRRGAVKSLRGKVRE